eukprot:6212984-Pleurochrysis_carterae.AAC.1
MAAAFSAAKGVVLMDSRSRMSARNESDLRTESHCLVLAAASPRLEAEAPELERCKCANMASTLIASGATRSSAVSRRESSGETRWSRPATMGSVIVATECVAFASTPTKDSASCPLEVLGMSAASEGYAARHARRNKSTYCAAAFGEARRSSSARHMSVAGKKSSRLGIDDRRKKVLMSCACAGGGMLAMDCDALLA